MTKEFTEKEIFAKLAKLNNTTESKLKTILVKASLLNIISEAGHLAICDGNGFEDMEILDLHMKESLKRFIDG